jgi:hypothetical protein
MGIEILRRQLRCVARHKGPGFPAPGPAECSRRRALPATRGSGVGTEWDTGLGPGGSGHSLA